MSAPKSKQSPQITVNITQDVIDTATQRDSAHCMIADALQAAVPNAKFISVDLATIRFTDTIAGKRYVYLTPRIGQVSLLAFDQGNKPAPFTLKLRSAHVLRTGSARKARASLEPQGDDTQGVPPERRDGQSPPLGPLAGGPAKSRNGAKATGGGAGNRTGRRREFGLRQIIR
jgi:hypothetical protein